MKKRRLTLRLKLTAFTIALFLCLSLIQMTISIISSGRLADVVAIPAANLIPTVVTVESSPEEAVPSVPMAAVATVEAAQRHFNMVAVISMLLPAIVGCGGIYLVVKRELKPLETLADQVSGLNVEKTAMSIRLPAAGDEIAQVATAIDGMTHRVSDAYEMQKNFSVNAAHELRTPLAIIQSKLEVFRLKHQRSQEEHEALNDVVYRNVIRLSDTVQALEALTNQREIQLISPVSLYALASEAAMELEILTAQTNISIEVTGDATLMGDDRLLQRMVFNLMENAVKYNVPGGRVVVALRESDQIIQLTVSDTGIGIPAALKPHIFDPFFRVDKSRSREMGGSGLGLALVSRIAVQHGGHITVEDNAPQGLVVQVTFAHGPAAQMK